MPRVIVIIEAKDTPGTREWCGEAAFALKQAADMVADYDPNIPGWYCQRALHDAAGKIIGYVKTEIEQAPAPTPANGPRCRICNAQMCANGDRPHPLMPDLCPRCEELHFRAMLAALPEAFQLRCCSHQSVATIAHEMADAIMATYAYDLAKPNKEED